MEENFKNWKINLKKWNHSERYSVVKFFQWYQISKDLKFFV